MMQAGLLPAGQPPVHLGIEAAALSWGRWALVAAVFTGLVIRYRHQIAHRRFAYEVALVVIAYFAYFAVRGLTQGDYELAAAHGWNIVRLEQTLDIQWEHWLQETLLPGHWAVTLFNWIYIWGHWPVIALTAMYLLFRHPHRYRTFRRAFLISGGLAAIIFATYPVAPPRLIDLGLVDTVSEYSTAYRAFQPTALTNQYAALPSLHFGWNLLIGIALWQTSTAVWRRALAVSFPALMGVAIVVTANHYVIDAAAGAAVALIALGLAHYGPTMLAGMRAQNGSPQRAVPPPRNALPR